MSEYIPTDKDIADANKIQDAIYQQAYKHHLYMLGHGTRTRPKRMRSKTAGVGKATLERQREEGKAKEEKRGKDSM